MMYTTARRISAASVIALSLIVSLLGCQAPANEVATPVAKTTAAAPATQAAPAATTTQAASQTAAAAQPASQTTAAPAAAPQTLKMGIQIPLTGPYVMIGPKNWLELAVNDINVTGFRVGDKTYKIEPIVVDDRFAPDGQVDAGNKLVLGEKVKFIVGATANASTAIHPVSEPAKVIIMGISPYDSALGSAHPFTFGIGVPSQAMLVPPVFNAVNKENPNLKKVGLLFPDDQSAPQHIRFATESANRLGLTIIGQELFPSSTKDFSPVVLRLMQKNPEIIYMAAMAASPVLFPGLITALREQGFKGALMGTNTYSTIVGPTGAKAEGLYGATVGDVESPLVPAKMKELAKRYVDKHGQQIFQADQITIYDMVSVLVQAMQKAGTVDGTEKIAQALRASEWDGVAGKGRFTGAKTFGAPAVYSQPVFVSKFAGGKFNVLSLTQAELP